MISEIAITPSAIEEWLENATPTGESLRSYGRMLSERPHASVVITNPCGGEWSKCIAKTIIEKIKGPQKMLLESLLNKLKNDGLLIVRGKTSADATKNIHNMAELRWIEEIDKSFSDESYEPVAKIVTERYRGEGYFSWKSIIVAPSIPLHSITSSCKFVEEYSRALEPLAHVSDFIVIASPYGTEGQCDDPNNCFHRSKTNFENCRWEIVPEFDRTLSILRFMKDSKKLGNIKEIHFLVNECKSCKIRQDDRSELKRYQPALHEKQAKELHKTIKEKLPDIPCSVHIVGKEDKIVERRIYFGHFVNKPDKEKQYRILCGASITHYVQDNAKDAAVVSLATKEDVKNAKDRYNLNKILRSNRVSKCIVCDSSPPN